MGAGSELDRWLPETPVHAYSDDVAAWHEVESQSTWWKARLAAAVDEQDGKLRKYAADVGVAYQARPESALKSSGGGQDDSLIVVEEEKPRACVRCRAPVLAFLSAATTARRHAAAGSRA